MTNQDLPISTPRDIVVRPLKHHNGKWVTTVFEITVRKAELLERVRANREEHRAIFDEAIEGYRRYATEQLERRISLLQAGKTIEETYRIAVPVDHTDDYDRVIGMLEMDVDDTITLPENLYAMYVDNDWDWAKNFAMQNAGYTTAIAGSQHYGKFLK